VTFGHLTYVPTQSEFESGFDSLLPKPEFNSAERSAPGVGCGEVSQIVLLHSLRTTAGVLVPRVDSRSRTISSTVPLIPENP